MAATNTIPASAGVDVLRSIHERLADAFDIAADIGAGITMFAHLVPHAESALRSWADANGHPVETTTYGGAAPFSVIHVSPRGLAGERICVYRNEVAS